MTETNGGTTFSNKAPAEQKRKRTIHDPIPIDEGSSSTEQEEALDLARRQLLASNNETSSMVHILGTGELGNFIAYCLAGLSQPPPITLLLHQPHKFQQWYDEGTSIEFMHNRHDSNFRTNFHVQYTGMQFKPKTNRTWFSDFDRNFGFAKNEQDWPIEKLIVTTTGSATISALKSIKGRLGPKSTICFLNQGLGLIDEVNKVVFPNRMTRPHYILGMVTHGLYMTNRKFGVIQTSKGNILLSSAPATNIRPRTEGNAIGNITIKRMDYGITESASNLLHNLVRCQPLSATGIPWRGMLRNQWEKLAVDSVINPLSVIFDCSYGQLVSNPAARRMMFKLLAETVEVIQSLPELRVVTDREKYFSVTRLQSIAYQKAKKLGDNISPMLRTLRAGHKTGISYQNGYIINRGRAQGIECYEHLTIVEMVKAKHFMASKKMEQCIPFG